MAAEGSRDLKFLIKLLTVDLSQFTFSQCPQGVQAQNKKEILREEKEGETEGKPRSQTEAAGRRIRD